MAVFAEISYSITNPNLDPPLTKEQKKNIIIWNIDRSLQICEQCYRLFDDQSLNAIYIYFNSRIILCNECHKEKIMNLDFEEEDN